MRWIAPRNQMGGALLVCALLAGVLVATVGAGYTASRTLFDSGGAPVAKGQDLVYINAETGKIEAEARGLAQGKNPVEIVTLADGRVAVVDKTANQVWLVDPGPMQPASPPIDLPNTSQPRRPQDKPVVLAPAPDGGYLGSGDLVNKVDQDGQRGATVKLPANLAGPAVPDLVEGIWVLLEDGQVVHVGGGEIRDTVSTGQPIEHLTIAGGRPIGITPAGGLLDLSARPLRNIGNEPVPHGSGVVVGSAKGSGRWILVVDPRLGRMVAVDVHTGVRHTFNDLPMGRTANLGEPIQVGDRVYIPEYTKHLLHVRDIGLNQSLQPVKVPGAAPTFALEVRDGRVWANDQFDRRVLVIGNNGSPELIDTGDGRGLTDTEKPNEAPGQNPDAETERPEPPRPPQVQPSTPRPEPKPEPTPKPTSAPKPPAPTIEVPRITPGTPIDQACQQVRQAGLECVPVAVGDGGSTDTVVAQDPTDPPAGTRVSRSFRVVVRYYGPTTVPGVVGQYTDNACKLLTDVKLKCVKQPLPDAAPRPEELDVVKDQNPRANAKAATDTDVTITYFDKALMYDYAGQTGANACMAFKQTYRKMDCQVREGATEQQTNRPAGVVYSQQPTAGSSVQMGESTATIVTFLVVKGSPRVPYLPNQSPENACAIAASLGYLCDSRAEDQLAKDRVVFAQEPPPGTPMDPGGTVVIHYPRYTPVPLHIYQRTNRDPVYILRGADYANSDYAIDRGVIGYGYQPGTPQSGTAPLFGHYCVGSTTTCLGFDRNHYVSRGSAIWHNGWQVAPESAAFRVIAACGAGMVQIYRVLDKSGGTYKYSIQTNPGGTYSEPLGCLWL